MHTLMVYFLRYMKIILNSRESGRYKTTAHIRNQTETKTTNTRQTYIHTGQITKTRHSWGGQAETHEYQVKRIRPSDRRENTETGQ